jgi:hypothetical protein
MWNYFPVALESCVVRKRHKPETEAGSFKNTGIILLHTEQSVQVSDTTKAL